jgi:quinolinate synthase
VTDSTDISVSIRALAAEKHAVILAHNYQIPEVQDVADFVGDSLGLSRTAAETDAEVIIFCGVHFMAETAKILAPGKTVILPVLDAGCPMADMITAPKLAAWKADHPGVPVVTYVNSSAEVKALTDVCCTSANAPQVVASLGVDTVLFAPDRNLAHWVAEQVPGVEVIAWNGFCPTHERIRAEMLVAAKAAHPEAEVLAHPECRPEILELADAVLSTSGMLRRAQESTASEFIIVTEEGLMHALAKAAPGKRFFTLDPCPTCPNMKKTTLPDVLRALQALEPRIEVADDVREAALAAVERMVEIG